MSNTNFAFIFPGQGSQKIGMLEQLKTIDDNLVTTVFNRASAVLGYDLQEVAETDSNSKINQTETTQPLLVATSFVIWQLWQKLVGMQPKYAAGHSLGEWSALVAAKVIEFEDAIALVAKRGRYMQSACKSGEGDMYAIVGLDDDTVIKCCAETTSLGNAVAANFNAPGQVVISGQVAATAKAVELCKAAGAKMAVPLPVSAPFHTQLMQPAAKKLAEDITAVAFKKPEITIIHNASLQSSNDVEQIKQFMIAQICEPVPWVKTIVKIASEGINNFVECGPGNVLTGLNKRINRQLKSFTNRNIDEINKAKTELCHYKIK